MAPAVPPPPSDPQPLLVLLLPRALEQFILHDQAVDLLTAPGAVAVEPGRVPYGAMRRLPEPLADAVAAGQARRLALDGAPRAVVIFHPLQYPLARALLARHPGAELWYSLWDRYPEAYDAGPRDRARLGELHRLASERAALTFAVSGELARLEHAEGRAAMVVPSAADRFPAPDPEAAVIAISLGHLGHRTDWALLRAVAERMPELVLLLVGEWHADEAAGDADFAWCRSAPGLVWLGRRSDEEAARLVLCADVGMVPFERSAFNAAGLPNRILKYARLGRFTVTPPLAGSLTWERALLVADGPDAFAAALRSQAGARTRPDPELRAWALAQTARHQNRPLWERMEALGIASGRLGSERAQPEGHAT